MLAHLTDVSVRSLLLAFPAAIAIWLVGRRRSAAWQHAIWTGVVCGMLALFAFGQVLPRLPLRVLDSREAPATVNNVATLPDSDLPGEVQAPSPMRVEVRRPIDWGGVVVYLYGTIALAFLVRFLTGVFLTRKLWATADPVSCGSENAVYETCCLTVPATVGWLRPRILLPLEWRDWTQEKLEAVLAHEGAHVRRHDGLIAALAHVNRCIFWFHPLAWGLEHRLTLLAERACDEFCVAALGDPHRYAGLLLEMASSVDRSQGRMRYHALTMAARSHIRQRIDSLLQDGRTFSRGLTWAGWTAVLLCGIPLVLCASAVDLARQPALLKLEIPRWSVPVPPLVAQKRAAPVMVAQARAVRSTPDPVALQTPVVSRHFMAVSVRPVTTQGNRIMYSGGPGSPDPEHLTWIATLRTLIFSAYHVRPDEINGPDLIDTEKYEVIAQVPPGMTTDQLREMTMNLLAERFGLVVHHVPKEVTAYQMTVASGGPKQLMPAAPPTEADAPTGPPSGPLETDAGGFPILPAGVPWAAANRGGMMRMTFRRGTMAFLASQLRSVFTRSGTGETVPVIDQTGVSGQFDFRLEIPEPRFRPTAQMLQRMGSGVTITGGDPSVGPGEISAVLEKQLGLRLDPEVTKVDLIVIDSVNKVPADN